VDLLGVDRAANTVRHLDVQLRQRILLISRCLGHVADRRLLDDILNQEPLDCLVLRNTASAVGAAAVVDMTAAVLATTVITTLFCHDR